MEALAAVQRDMPFNDCYQMLAIEGDVLDERQGGDCIRQVEKVVEERRAEGAEIRVVPAMNVLHFCAIERREGRDFLLDPFLLQCEPIDITDVVQKAVTRVFSCYPIIGEQESKVLVGPGEGGTIFVKRRVFDSCRIREAQSFQFNLKRRFESVPSWAIEHLKRVIRRRFMVRFLNDDGTVTSMDWAGREGSRVILAGKGLVYEPGYAGYEQQVDIVATHLGMTREELFAMFDKATRIYKEL